MTDAPYILIALMGSTLLAVALLMVLIAANTSHQLELLRLMRVSLQARPTDDPPLPVDEARPPAVRTYVGDPPGTRCTCHGELLRPGSTTMVWPLPGSDEIRVFCELSIPGRP